MGKKMLSLLSAIFVLCIYVESKITSFPSCSEYNFFMLVDKMFQHILVHLSRLIDTLLTYIIITETLKELSLQMKKNQNIQTVGL